MSPHAWTLRALLGAFLLGGPAAAAGQTAPGDERARSVHLLQRATYGARAEDIEAVLADGREAWLERQLHPESIDDSALVARLEPLESLSMSLAELYAKYPTPRSIRAMYGAADSLDRGEVLRDLRARGLDSPRRIGAELAAARLQRALYSERQLEAVMTEFWFNHFNVFWGKGMDRWLVPSYEQGAIRPHVFGTFEALLSATARHPAMLFYLDNWRSIAPDSLRPAGTSRAAREIPEGAGLNENYARELLELHTLGVDGGYTQADVEAAARALTGWSIAGRGEAPEFRFRPALHDVAEKRFLGHVLPAGGGIEDGEALLRILARHPSTARHVAHELAVAFVADAPPPALVDRLARVFLDTGGDLREVTRALFTAPEFYAPALRGSKAKSPFDLVASALRLTGADVALRNGTAEYLRSAGEIPFGARDPIGYPERAADWIDGGAMLQRMNLALELAAGQMPGVEIDADALMAEAARRAGRVEVDPVEALAMQLVPGGGSGRVADAVRADLDAAPAAPVAEGARALGLILGSPEFQRR